MKIIFVRFFLPILLIMLIPCLLSNCGEGDEAEKSPSIESLSQSPSPEPAPGIVQTREDPGAYRGKEDSHVPRISWEKSGAGLRVTVSVDHEMNPDKPHYIKWIGLWDDAGNHLGEKRFQAADEAARAVFELDRIPSGLNAYETCNLHGIWLEATKVLVEIP